MKQLKSGVLIILSLVLICLCACSRKNVEWAAESSRENWEQWLDIEPKPVMENHTAAIEETLQEETTEEETTEAVTEEETIEETAEVSTEEATTEQATEAPKEWTAWSSTRPDYVNDTDYEKDERILYSSRKLETTSSTTQRQMEGWELYDTVKNYGNYGEWSSWTGNPVGGSDTRDVQSATFYRYRDLETTTSSSSAMSGWELYNTTSSWGNYGSWSNWSVNPVSGSDSRKVETKTQYSYQDIWTTQVYTDWSGWSGWSETKEETSDLKKEETRTVWGYYYFQCSHCGAHWHGCNNVKCWTWGGGCGSSDPVPEGIHLVWSPISWDNAGLQDWHGTGATYTYIDGQLVFKWWGETRTQYRYATRSLSNVTNYSGWSEYSDSAVSASASREVTTRIVYRYCDRPQVMTYYFRRWGGWSNWTANAVSSSNTRQAETTPFYRYRDRSVSTTYYFKKWGAWSEYGVEPVESTDTLQVRTATQYRFMPK